MTISVVEGIPRVELSTTHSANAEAARLLGQVASTTAGRSLTQ